MTRFEVVVHLASETSVQEVSKVFEGLQSLADQGVICCEYATVPADLSYPRVLRLSVSDGSRNSEIAIDVADQPELFHRPDLDGADVYFKRSFWPEEVNRLPPVHRAKVRPFGLNNPAIRIKTALRLLRTRRSVGPRQQASDARRLLALPSPSAFQCPPDAPAEQRIFFQVQLWDPKTNGEQAIAINEERAELVRGLRSAFGPRFAGGVIPTDFAKIHYPQLLTNLPSSMRAYPRVVRRPLIAIYSRGLHDSVAFKMSEYLAASRCIVGHAPTATLPVSLMDGQNYLGFRTLDQCVARCEQLLSRPDEADAMRRANWDYYCANVEPSAHLLAILERAFQPG